MNLLITLRCNKKCPYCFVNNNQNKEDMTLEEVEYITSMPDFENESIINILGGEPTLHAELREILEVIHRRNRNPITIFSNLSSDPSVLEEIELNDIIIVANIFGEETKLSKNVDLNLKIANRKGWDIILSYTIVDLDFDIDEIINVCKRYKIRAVRWSLAMPASDKENVHYVKHFGLATTKKITCFISELLQNGIVSFNDCPLPVCSGLQDIAESIKKEYKLPRSFQPIKFGVCAPPYDILPGFQVRGCMGIGEKISLNLKDYGSLQILMAEYQKYVEELRSCITLKECVDCQKKTICGGGCLGYAKY